MFLLLLLHSMSGCHCWRRKRNDGNCGEQLIAINSRKQSLTCTRRWSKFSTLIASETNATKCILIAALLTEERWKLAIQKGKTDLGLASLLHPG